MIPLLVAAYLAAIVAANLIITVLGPAATIPTAFVLIGLDITARDALHDAWRERGLVWRMAALIAAGSLLSFALNQASGRIALASCAAFAAANSADAFVYHLARRRPWFDRVTRSNAVSALIDSLVFPTLAFGVSDILWVIVAGQFIAKLGGGTVWAWVLQKVRRVDNDPS